VIRVKERKPKMKKGSDIIHQKAAHCTGKNPSAMCIAAAGFAELINR
jgi:hypothetical protein